MKPARPAKPAAPPAGLAAPETVFVSIPFFGGRRIGVEFDRGAWARARTHMAWTFFCACLSLAVWAGTDLAWRGRTARTAAAQAAPVPEAVVAALAKGDVHGKEDLVRAVPAGAAAMMDPAATPSKRTADVAVQPPGQDVDAGCRITGIDALFEMKDDAGSLSCKTDAKQGG